MEFGTSGLRGLVADMDDASCRRWTSAFLDHLARNPGASVGEVLVARDLRPSSPRIAAACLGAIADAGLRAVDCGAVPTPALALEAMRRGAAAVMVTGSHIPFDRNGIKFYRPEGEITKADEAGIRAAHDRPVHDGRAPAGTRGPLVAETGVGARYAQRITQALPGQPLTGTRIGVYQHSAVGRDLLAEILESLGAAVVPLGRSDDFVPIDTEAVRDEDAALARRWTAEHGLGAVISTDGDGDRPLIADETGQFLRGDVLGILTARELAADGVATPVSSTTALERCGWFPRVVRTRIGSPHVIDGMNRLLAEGARAPVAFEANGGFLVGAAFALGVGTIAALPTRDAVLPIICVLTAAARQGVPLSALAAALPARSTASDRLTEVDRRRSGALLALVEADPSAILRDLGLGPLCSVDHTDGLRLSFDGGDIVHLRPSGNAPELRCYAEAGDPERARRLVAGALDAVARHLPA